MKMKFKRPRPLHVFSAAALLAASSRQAWAKICLMHESTVVRPLHHANDMFGGHEKDGSENGVHTVNVSAVRLISCPIYSQCCSPDESFANGDMSSHGACCFDYPWFWSSVAVVLLTVLVGIIVSIFYWKKKRQQQQLMQRVARSSFATHNVGGRGDTPISIPMSNVTTLTPVQVVGCYGPQSHTHPSKAPDYSRTPYTPTTQPGYTTSQGDFPTPSDQYNAGFASTPPPLTVTSTATQAGGSQPTAARCVAVGPVPLPPPPYTLSDLSSGSRSVETQTTSL